MVTGEPSGGLPCWDWSSCCKTHCHSSAEKQPPLWPHSAEHLHFLAILLANLQALPVQSIVPCLILCCISLLKVTTDLQQHSLDSVTQIKIRLRGVHQLFTSMDHYTLSPEIFRFIWFGELFRNQQTLVLQPTGGLCCGQREEDFLRRCLLSFLNYKCFWCTSVQQLAGITAWTRLQLSSGLIHSGICMGVASAIAEDASISV